MKTIIRYFTIQICCLLITHFTVAQELKGVSQIGDKSNDEYGTALSISSDGSVIGIGGYSYVDIKKWENGEWIQKGQRLKDSLVYLFGINIALSEDGNRVAIGSLNSSVNVYRFVNGTWIKAGDNIFPETNSSRFGMEVDLSGQGKYLAIGDPHYGQNNSWIGSVDVYYYNGQDWSQLGNKFKGGFGTEQLGTSVSLSNDGKILAIGAPGLFESSLGYVEIFRWNGNDWLQVGSRILSTSPGEWFGYSVKLSGNGERVVVGSSHSNGDTLSEGAVRVFDLVDKNWVQVGNRINGLETNNYFGRRVSISNNGNIIGAGAYSNKMNGTNSGMIGLYRFVNDDWELIGDRIFGSSGEYLGYSLGISGDGKSVIVSSPGKNFASVYDFSSLLGFETLKNQSLKYFPNPVNSIFHTDLRELSKYIIYNSVGQEVKTGFVTNGDIDFSVLPKGNYFVKISDGNEIITSKVMKL